MSLLKWKEKLLSVLSRPPAVEEPMWKHTSMRIGGPAEIMAFPQSINELRIVLELAAVNNVPLFVIGQGTNLLVKDGGVRGIVLNLVDMSYYSYFEKSSIRAGASVKLTYLVKEAIRFGLRGLEFASGIPGSLGGAIYMNAGAYNKSIGQLVSRIKLMDYEGNFFERTGSELVFGYRWSSLQEEKLIILEGVLDLIPGEREEIRRYAEQILQERQEKHPNFPSAGSFFRNPPGKTAGYLIEKAGAKGFAVGDAQVSMQHGNFIINKGEATAEDVLNLMEMVKEKVKSVMNVELEPEVRIIGENCTKQERD